MAREIYICQSGDHNKYWIVEQDEQNPAVVHVKNGRLGAEKGQIQKPRNEGSEFRAKCFIDDKVQEKRRKGYRKIDERQFQIMSRQAAVVGLQNKCTGLTWVERLPHVYPGGHQTYKRIHDSRLADPDYDPVLLVNLSTRKEYGGRTDFRLLFTPDTTFEVVSSMGSRDTGCDYAFQLRPVDAIHPLHELTEKVEAGLSLLI